MERLKIIQQHLTVSNCRHDDKALYNNSMASTCEQKSCNQGLTTVSCHGHTDTLTLHKQLQNLGVSDVEVQPPPFNHEECFRTILTAEAVKFVSDLVREFDGLVDEMLCARSMKALKIFLTKSLPDFPKDTQHIRDSNWKVKQVPERLQCRHVDLGDVSPSNTSHFVAALKSKAQGIQTDFDDGHCPSWSNQLLGLYNVYQAVHNNIQGVPSIDKAPVLMLRPRAWNMIEHNLLVNGKEVPGPLFDFGLLMFHNARILLENGSGPFFYLSKLEGSDEAKLWNRIFDWTENKLQLPHGCIKACVLIENIFASFEMEEILYELRDHSAGLNCGIWDYSASFINKFGGRPEFVLPDRNKYVSMDRHFLKCYMDLVVKTCHKHGAHATGGMAALILPDTTQTDPSYQQVLHKVTSGKKREIEAGVDGFMVYDLRLVEPMQERMSPSANQLAISRSDVSVMASDLLRMPSGSVTLAGLKHNITVGILFIEAWLRGQGHYFYKGAVEDSATAEISRSQVWQWIRHQARLEDNNETITLAMVQSLIEVVTKETFWSSELSNQFVNDKDLQRLTTAAKMFEEIITKRNFPEFITTYLSQNHTFLSYHGNKTV